MAAGEQDGAHYEGVLQCHFGGRAFADGAWAQGDGVQAFPRGQLLAGCLSRKGRTERRAHTGWRTHGAPPGTGVNVPGMDSAVYVVNGSRSSCNACRCALRGHLASSLSGQLASSLSGQGKHAEAEEMEREVLAVRKRVLGAEHPDTLTTASNLASSLSRQGKHAEAG